MELRYDIKGAKSWGLEQLTWVVLVETWGPNTRKRSAPFGWMYFEPSIHQPEMQVFGWHHVPAEIEWNELHQKGRDLFRIVVGMGQFFNLDMTVLIHQNIRWFEIRDFFYHPLIYLKLYFLPSFGSCSAKRGLNFPNLAPGENYGLWTDIYAMNKDSWISTWTRGFGIAHVGWLVSVRWRQFSRDLA